MPRARADLTLDPQAPLPVPYARQPRQRAKGTPREPLPLIGPAATLNTLLHSGRSTDKQQPAGRRVDMICACFQPCIYGPGETTMLRQSR